MTAGAGSEISACVINHNGAHYLAESLPAVMDAVPPFAEIVVVDDASLDGSVELVEKRFPNVRLVRLPLNSGPGAARNLGLREARHDRVLFIDNDVRVTPDCASILDRMLEAYPRVVAAMPSVVYADRPDTVQYDGADCHFLGQQILTGQDAPVASRPTDSRPMSSLVTCCFLLDRSRLPDGATFDESLFTQYEDHDFGVRLRALGGELLSVPEALCYHGSGTVGLSIRQLGGYSRIRVLGLIRNRWALILKTWSLRTLFLLAPLLAVHELVQLVMVIKRGWLREWLHAVWWILTHSRELLEKRRRVQRAKEVPDRQLLKDGPLPFRPDLASDILERAGQRALNGLATAYWRLVAPLV
jgi:hypothetical protein